MAFDKIKSPRSKKNVAAAAAPFHADTRHTTEHDDIGAGLTADERMRAFAHTGESAYLTAAQVRNLRKSGVDIPKHRTKYRMTGAQGESTSGRADYANVCYAEGYGNRTVIFPKIP